MFGLLLEVTAIFLVLFIIVPVLFMSSFHASLDARER